MSRISRSQEKPGERQTSLPRQPANQEQWVLAWTTLTNQRSPGLTRRRDKPRVKGKGQGKLKLGRNAHVIWCSWTCPRPHQHLGRQVSQHVVTTQLGFRGTQMPDNLVLRREEGGSTCWGVQLLFSQRPAPQDTKPQCLGKDVTLLALKVSVLISSQAREVEGV